MAGGISPYRQAQLDEIERRRREAAAKSEPATPDEKRRSIVEKVDAAAVQAADERKLMLAIQAEKKRQVQADKVAKMGVGERALDVGKAAVAGVKRGIASTPGAAFDIYRLGQLGRAYSQGLVTGRPGSAVLEEQDLARAKGTRENALPAIPPEVVKNWGGQAWIDTADRAAPGLGLKFEGETPEGRMAGRMTEAIGGAATGGALGGLRGGFRGSLRNLTREGAIGAAGGAGMEGARALTDSPGWGTAAGLATGGLAAMYGGRGAETALRNAGRNANPDQVRQANDLFNRAQREGIALTRTNALDYVTRGGAVEGSDLQRIVESGSGNILPRFYSERQGGVQQAGNRLLDEVGPRSGQPSGLGERVAAPSQALIDETRGQALAAVQPQYRSFQDNPVPDPDLDRLRQDRAFGAAQGRVRTNDDYADLLRPPGTVGEVDLIRRDMENRRTNLQTAGAAPEGMNPTAAGGLAQPINRAQAAAAEASGPPMPNAPGQPQPRPLENAQQEYAGLLEANVVPLDQGPVGQLARSTTTEGAQAAAFPPKPLEGSEIEIGRAIGNLSQRDPNLATEFVRNYLGTEFSTQTKPNIAGEPYSAGTKFWNTVAGGENSQQRANIRAAVEALPGGPQRWGVVEEIGQLFEAMGKRQAPGSKTAANIEKQEALASGGTGEELVKFFSGGLSAGKDALDRYRLGNNMNEIADLITNPAREADFARILNTTPGSGARAWAIWRMLSQEASAATRAQSVARPTVEEEENQPMQLRGIQPRGP